MTFIMSSSIHKVDPNFLTLEDPRAALLKFYSQSSIPDHVTIKTDDQKTVRALPTPSERRETKPTFAHSQVVTAQLFENDTQPLLKREEISHAILSGNFEVANNNNQSFFQLEDEGINQSELEETRFNAHMNRYNYQRPPFVLVAGAPPARLDRRNIKELQKHYQWNLDCKGSAFVWAGEFVEPSPPVLLDRRPPSTKGQRDNASKAVLANKK